MQEPNHEELTVKIKRLLAESLGVESEDISDDDSFSDDLHMSPAQLTDFIELLSGQGLETARIEITELETLQDLIETLSSHQEIS